MSLLLPCALLLGPLVATDVFPFDPVELVAGRELPGREDLSIERGRHRYLFASEENARRFRADPEPYTIRLGGACARMGALSGTGRPELFAVHDGAIFLFASEACRATFLKDPCAVLAADDAAVEEREAGSARARELLARTLATMGGAERIDAVRTFREETRTEYESSGVSIRVLARRFDGGTARQESFGEWHRLVVATPDAAFLAEDDEVWDMHPEQRRALEREADRHPLAILRARSRPDFRAQFVEEGTVEGAQVDFVDVSFDGLRTRMGLDSETGQVVSLGFRGRGKGSFWGELELRYDDQRVVDGVSLPFARKAHFDGEPFGKRVRLHAATLSFGVDEGDDLFQRPRSPFTGR